MKDIRFSDAAWRQSGNRGCPLPVPLRRYRRVVYRIAGATTTGGSVSSYLANDVQAQQVLPSGFQVA